MTTNWSNQLELAFLECLQAEPVLWNPKLKEYKNKLKQHDAWMRISTVLDIPVDELKKKKESLMSSYRSYRTKVIKSIQSGAGTEDLYQPIWFAYEVMDSFLGDTLHSKKTINTESVNNDEEKEQEANKENMEEGQKSKSQPANNTNEQNRTIRRRQNPTELIDAGNVVKEALATFKNTMKTKESIVPPPSQDDDCDLYAKLLATKLRQLSAHKRLKLMHEIDGMYIRYQYEQSPSPVPLPSPLRSPSVNPNFSYNFNPYTRSQPLSKISEPRPGTASSTYSEPPIHYAPMFVPQSSPSNIIIHSNEIISATDYPVIHIPDQNSDPASMNVVHNTPSTELNSPNSVNEENNIIRRAYNLC